jgi:sigma-B regulation protein RsbU (phosphoserine phosphatase)
VGTRGIIRDISIRVKAEEILKKAKEAAEARAGELASINRVAEKVSSSLNLQDILLTACQELSLIFPIHKAGIALLNKQDSQLKVMAFHSILPEEKSRQGKILYLEGEGCMDLQLLIKAKKTVRIRDAQGEPLLKPLHNLFGKTASGSFMVVPLITRGKTLGIIGMTLKDAEFEFKGNRIELAETVASQIATAVDNAKLHAKTEEALDMAERDLEIGSEIQSGFFPPYLPEIHGWELGAYFKAARQVSGDFYDVFPLENTPYTGLVVADVCDKGVGAALFMVLLRSLIRSYSEQHRKDSKVDDLLLNIALKVNRYIVQTHGQSNMFATLFLGILDPETNRLYYVNGGHDSPLLVDASGKLKNELVPTGPAFGFSTDLDFEIGTCEFSSGDILLSFTDGFTEAKNISGDFYTDERLFNEFVRDWPSAFSAVRHLELDVNSHMGEQVQFDDITLLVLRRKEENETACHRLCQKALLPNLPLFRNFVSEVCQAWKLETSISENMQLAVDEVCSNLILHGYDGMEEGYIVLSVKKLKGSLQLILEDSGIPFDPSFLDPPVLGDKLDDRQIGGLGVYMVRELVDELSYESRDGRNCLILKMNYSHN